MEKAYIAGLVDAKASLGIYPHRIIGRAKQKLVASLTLHGHDIKMLRMIQGRYGGTIKFIDMSKEKDITVYRLEIVRYQDILSLIRDISEYLIAKRGQAALLQKYCQSRLKALQYVENSFEAPFTEEERAIARELRRLNELFLHPERF